MKKLLSIIIMLFILYGCNQTSKVDQDNELKDGQTADKVENYGNKYGADEYGMKRYVMALLKRGPNRHHDSATVARIQKGHMDNISRMAENGDLVLAGPFLDDGEIRGIYIFNTETIEDAKALTKSDPAIQSGRLIMELHPWYGSAAIMELNNLHEKFSKKDH